MDEALQTRLEDLEKKLDAVFRSVEKMRRFFFWTLVLTVVMVVLPLIGLVFAIPAYLGTLNSLTAGI